MAEKIPPLPEKLPSVLPSEEATAATSDGPEIDLAELEAAWLNSSLSGHAVEAAALKNELARAHIKNIDADRGMRTKYAGRILLYLEFYSGGVGCLLLLSGFKPWGFALEQTVITTLVGSTAVAAIGLVGFIARGLFRSPPEPPSI
jgi:hypothetical protein